MSDDSSLNQLLTYLTLNADHPGLDHHFRVSQRAVADPNFIALIKVLALALASRLLLDTLYFSSKLRQFLSWVVVIAYLGLVAVGVGSFVAAGGGWRAGGQIGYCPVNAVRGGGVFRAESLRDLNRLMCLLVFVVCDRALKWMA